MEEEAKKKNFKPYPGLKIAKEVAVVEANKDKNFVLSPISIQLGLSLLANGAKGLIKEELLNFLEAESLDDLNLHNKELVDVYTLTREEEVLMCVKDDGPSYQTKEELIEYYTRCLENSPILSFFGGIWIDQSMSLNPKFITDAQDFYKAKVDTVDFQYEANKVIYKVNQWAEDATNGLIKSVIPESSFHPLTRVVLANALYFKGRWCYEFYESSTKDSKFYLLDGNCVEVPFMTGSERQYVTTFDDFKVLMLPYRGSMLKHLSMYIILPNKRDGLWSLLEKVGSDSKFLERYVRKHREEVIVGMFGLPKFKITYDFEASKILQSLGLKSCFSNEAEFDEMALNFKHDDGLEISKVYHKSYIEVNEEGTEAASITGGDILGADLLPPMVPVDFVADHPFMFLIRDEKSGMVLFMGHVVNPSLE